MLQHVLKFTYDAQEYILKSTGETEPWYKRYISLLKGSNVGALIFKLIGFVNVAHGIPQKWLQLSAVCRPQLQKCDYNYRNNWQHFRKPKHAPAPRRSALLPSSIPPCLYLAVQPSAAHHTLFPIQMLQLRGKLLLGCAADMGGGGGENAPNNIWPSSAEPCNCQ